MKYSISALARKTGLSIHTLRFYEKEGLLRHVERSDSGRRLYGEASLGCLLGVLCLKQAGMTLPQIKIFFDETVKGATSLSSRAEMIQEARSQLEEKMQDIKRGLDLIDFFLDGTKRAAQAAREGKNPDEVFPFITLTGIVNFPFMKDSEGKLEPAVPAAAPFSNTVEREFEE